MLKKFRPIFKIIEWILFVFLLCLLFIVISPKLPIKNIPKSFVVVSGSMEPSIKTGSVAFTREVDSKTIKTGDIIAFTSPSNPNDTILHRVHSISSTDPLTFKTKGDNNNDIDAWDVTDVGVKGVYITTIPYLGSIAAFIKKPLGFVLIIGIPALFFIIFQLLNIKKAITEEVDRKVSQKIAESKNSNPTKTILKSIIFFILFISASFSLSSIHIIKAVFSDTVSIDGINISIADFTKPSRPILVSPTDNSFTSTNGLIMEWEDSNSYTSPSSIYYIYQSSHQPDFISLTYQSGYLSKSQIPAPNTPNGIYYWRVKSCFASGNCSDWSETWKVTVGSIYLTSDITPSTRSTTSANTDINISSDYLNNKINLAITNISSPLDYEILYTGNGLQKGLVGHINNDEIIDSKYSTDLYFGTCSNGGNCTPENVEIGSIITVNLTGGQTLTKTFNY